MTFGVYKTSKKITHQSLEVLKILCFFYFVIFRQKCIQSVTVLAMLYKKLTVENFDMAIINL